MKRETKKILVVIGTRPNYMKVTRFKQVAASYPWIDLRIVHTGQHYDVNMADVFFSQFGLTPDYFLSVPAAGANALMAEIMLRLEQLMVKDFIPDLLVVVGDVNSTLAASLVANNMKIKLAHVESGLRSFDRSMPEEINRILTDELADLFFVTEPSGIQNLSAEKKDSSKIYFVGNTMIDTLSAFTDRINESDIIQKLDISNAEYVLMTIHRPATVDFEIGLKKLLELIEYLAIRYKVVFPIHPRTVNNLKKFGLYDKLISNKNLIVSEPLDYFAFQKLVKHCKVILTDSGGIQEESTWLSVPCLTLRPSTERPVTCDVGTNTLLPFDLDIIRKYISEIEKGTYKKGQIPEKWDGRATERIFDVIAEFLA